MSLPESKSTKPVGVLVRKPKATIYVSLLGVAVVALLVACLLLVLELHQYDYIWNFPWNPSGVR